SLDLHAQFDAIGLDVSDWTLSEEVTLPYNHNALVDVDVVNQTLTYTPESDFTGIDRILFSFTDAEQNPRIGQVDIAISTEANQGLTVQENIIYPKEVEASTQVEIDISPYVTSPDGDDYQLVYLQAFNAQVRPVAPEDMYNKKFYFESSYAGYHDIAFAVSDHQGTYEMGLMRIEVVDDDQLAKWGPIRYGADVFTAPLTTREALDAGVVFNGSHLDTNYDPAIQIALFNFESAMKYCESIGASVPTVEQLKELDRNVDIPAENWPLQAVKKNYYAQVDGQSHYVKLDSGYTVPNDGQEAMNLTCISQGELEVSLPDSKLEAIADQADKATVAVRVTPGFGSDAEGLVVTAYLSEGTEGQLGSTSEVTDESGLAVFEVTNHKAELVTLNAEYEGITVSESVTFIGDVNTAKLTLSTTLNNQYHAQTNEVTAVLHDALDNPLVGYNVSFSADTDSVDVTQGLTDADGKLVSKITWTDLVPTDVYSNATIIAKFDEGPEPSTQSSDVTFITIPMCGTGVNDSNPNNAVGSCLKVKEFLRNGKKMWLTSTPSKNVMDTLGYTQDSGSDNSGKTYDFLLNETGVHGPAGQFATFQYNNKDTGQFNRFCNDLNEMHFGGKNDWTRPEVEDLKATGYYMYENYGWPTLARYWTRNLPREGIRVTFDLHNGNVVNNSVNDGHYGSCISGK
ncbi:hypothetical protein PO80_12995, partial [Vibrio parahaemolyticus]